MIISGFGRLTRDVELRTIPSGESVCGLSVAFNHGKKGADGNRPTEYLEASLWGRRAEVLAPMLLKGTPVVVAVEDPHIETYQGKNGPGSKLVGKVLSIEFAGKAPDREGQAFAPARSAPRQAAPANAKRGSGFDDMEDDIPF